jgi:hypothetical protein
MALNCFIWLYCFHSLKYSWRSLLFCTSQSPERTKRGKRILRRPVFLRRKTPKLSPQSTYIPRVPQWLSPRWNWDPHPLSRKRVCFPSGTKGGGGFQTRLRVRGWGSPNSDDWRENLVLCLLCEVQYVHYPYRLLVTVFGIRGCWRECETVNVWECRQQLIKWVFIN